MLRSRAHRGCRISSQVLGAGIRVRGVGQSIHDSQRLADTAKMTAVTVNYLSSVPCRPVVSRIYAGGPFQDLSRFRVALNSMAVFVTCGSAGSAFEGRVTRWLRCCSLEVLSLTSVDVNGHALRGRDTSMNGSGSRKICRSSGFPQ